MKNTKIVCTIGPSSEKLSVLKNLIANGMNVARLNFSHGSHENHQMLIDNVRKASESKNVSVAIIQDLQGPKIRVSALEKPIQVKKNQTITIGKDFNIDHDIYKYVKAGHSILIEDGLIELKVVKLAGNAKSPLIICKAVSSGMIQSHKGINLPDSDVPFPIITEKDKKDLIFGLQSNVDFIALSFVSNATDIRNVRKLIKKYNPKGKSEPKIIAKIERRAAVNNFESILHECDAIMIARGDLGVEIPDIEVPLVQKQLIDKCIKYSKPVIVATQMLDSMIRNPRPTRAEVSDVANAVIDQADAVMLSGESAFGAYAEKAVSEMNRIIMATEGSDYVRDRVVFHGSDNQDTKASLIADAVNRLAEGVGASAIIGTTESGYTARFVSHHRPNVPIIIMTDRPKIYRQLSLYWGVEPLYVDSLSALKDVPRLLNHFMKIAKKKKLVKSGDKAVLVAGNPLGQRMNLVQVVDIK